LRSNLIQLNNVVSITLGIILFRLLMCRESPKSLFESNSCEIVFR